LPPAIEDAREQVLPEVVRAERMRERGTLQHRREVDVVDRQRPEDRADQHAEDEDDQHRRARHRKPVLAEAAPRLLPGPDMRAPGGASGS
jgi:hypothetical protein